MATTKELRALITLAGRIDPSLQRAMLRASGESAKLARNTEKSVQGLSKVTNSVRSVLTGPAMQLAGLLTTVLGVQKVIDTADAWTTVRSRIGLVTEGVQQQQESLEAVFSIAQKTKQSFEATGDLYTKIAMNAKQLKLANGDVLQITDTVNKALRIGGGTTQQSEAAIMQFSQALASGRLQGDELRSLLENAPRLTKAIAEGLGVATGDLKKFGSEGALTADVIIAALKNQTGVINEEFTKMPVTIRGAFTYFNNAFGKFVDDTGKKTNVFNRISAGIVQGTDVLFNKLQMLGESKSFQNYLETAGHLLKAMGNAAKFLYDNSNTLIPILAGLAFTITSFKVVGTVTRLMDLWKASTFAMTYAQHGLNAAMRANVIGLVITGIGLLVAAGVYLYRNWDEVSLKAHKLWVNLKNSFAEGVNYLIGKINVIIDGINKITGKHIAQIQLVGYDTSLNSMGGLRALELQGYAYGGIATRASIFGEAGPEMAIPLQRSQRSFDLLGMANRILGYKSGGGNVIHLNINVDARGNPDAEGIAGRIKEVVRDVLEEITGEEVRVSFG